MSNKILMAIKICNNISDLYKTVGAGQLFVKKKGAGMIHERKENFLE